MLLFLFMKVSVILYLPTRIIEKNKQSQEETYIKNDIKRFYEKNSFIDFIVSKLLKFICKRLNFYS